MLKLIRKLLSTAFLTLGIIHILFNIALLLGYGVVYLYQLDSSAPGDVLVWEIISPMGILLSVSISLVINIGFVFLGLFIGEKTIDDIVFSIQYG